MWQLLFFLINEGMFRFQHGYRQLENRSTHHLGRSVAAMSALCQSHVRSDQTEGLDRSRRRRRVNRRTKAPLPRGELLVFTHVSTLGLAFIA